MKIRTRKNQAILDLANGVLPSSLKHWWKCDEATGATTLVDAVGGANFTVPAITASAGVIASLTSITQVATAASLADPGTADFMFLIRGQTGTTSSMSLGNTSGNKITFNGSLLGQSLVVGADGSTTSLPASDNALATWAIVRNSGDSGKIATWKDGSISGSSVADAAGAITLADMVSMSAITNVAMMALFVFDGTIPQDFGPASLWMGTQHAANNKWIWPSRNEAWGTWG